jgi:hypothetical protein
MIEEAVMDPKVTRDLVLDPDAVYGYKPSEDGRLSAYVEYDWTDPGAVSEATSERLEYVTHLKETETYLYETAERMQLSGLSETDVRKYLSSQRNLYRMDTYKDNPTGLEMLKKSNLAQFGNEIGPDYTYFNDLTIDEIIQSSTKSNVAMDIITGIYTRNVVPVPSNGVFDMKTASTLTGLLDALVPANSPIFEK